jgi:UDP-glucose 4-epimerase
MEAVKTNILGTENVIKAAVANKVKRVVVLSTDKAVYPINAMGISKAMAEKIVGAHTRLIPEGGTVVCSTRYGNVMASRGSVIPLFIDQIKANKALTLTDPNMTRFLMSLDDSVELVMYAFKHAKQGDLFVQKAPASTVDDLAKALSEMYKVNYSPQIIGTRHGEKLYETLISREEMARAEDLGEYYRIPSDSRDLNYAKYFVEGKTKIAELEDYTSHNTHRLDTAGVKELLCSLDYVKEKLNA